MIVEYLNEPVLTTSDEVKFGVLKVCKSSLVLVRVKTVDTPVEKVFEVNDKGLGFDWIFSVNASSVEVVLGNFPIILTVNGLVTWKFFVVSSEVDSVRAVNLVSADVLSRVKKSYVWPPVTSTVDFVTDLLISCVSPVLEKEYALSECAVSAVLSGVLFCVEIEFVLGVFVVSTKVDVVLL